MSSPTAETTSSWSLLDALGDAVLLLDHDGRVEALNLAARQKVARPAPEVGQSFLESARQLLGLDAEATERVLSSFHSVADGGREMLRVEVLPATEHRPSMILTLRKYHPGVLLHLRTLSEMGEVAAMIQESEERYRNLVEGSGDIIFVTDFESRMLYANKALEEQTGYTAADFQMTQKENPFIHPEDAPRVGRFIGDFLASNQQHSKPVENRFISKDGRVLWYSSVISRCTYAGKPGMQFVVHNITELRRAQEERDRLIREARNAVRVRDEFLSVASHELKTPVTSIMAYAQQLLRRSEGVAQPDGAVRSLKAIERQCRKLARLVNQLLDVSRIEAGRLILEPERTDLKALAQEISVSAARPVRVEGPDQAWAEVDPLRIEQVITNLLDNAIKFSDERTPIQVAVEETPTAVTISVTDSGIGIPPDQREQIFERFHQVPSHPLRGGMGLGLYISRQIAELHGGTLTAECPPSGGTRMRLTLPLKR